MHRSHALCALGACLLAACGEFEVRSIVLDLRVLAMNVTPPEIVIPLDFDEPPSGLEDIEIPDIEVCALVADPAASRSLTYFLGACAQTFSGRCDEPTRPYALIARGTIGDPEESAEPQSLCAVITPSLPLVAVVQDAFENDPLSGFGGLPIHLELIAHPAGGTIEDGVVAVKRLILSPQIPAERVANSNPALDALMIEAGEGEPVPAPLGRCADVEPIPVERGQVIKLVPEEREGAREEYMVPAFDGSVRTFTENLTYSWYATAGSWQREITGGPKDIAGNDPPLDSKWTAPRELDGARGGDVSIWVVQRDERGGLAWYETCVRVGAETL
jgi:hypothetical protein